ncbi:MAG: Possibl zinc metallo-peptidase [Planctomycetes bacterium ADurb.Bin126]|nr:MAG: Possibl zinc metallo-peptidase [Planctomycetes bacterium ADurb.Bin126]HOD80917.1 metallopeptidase family protein [Phycisphaerae bacterium]HQL75068.1 metallopeptidase family protein [Phycisphaerae bacterium]
MIRLSARQFDDLVQEAIESLPNQFRRHMENLSVEVQDKPAPALLRQMDMPPGELLMGLYHGVPLTDKSVTSPYEYPERILLFKGNIEQVCETVDDVVDEIYYTVLHEVGHHFGMDEDELDELGYG